MSVIKKLASRSLLLNKKRTIGTIIGIILSVSLICAVSGMFTSMHKSLIQNAVNETGYYHLKLASLNETELNTLKSNRKISHINEIYDLGYSNFEHDNTTDPYIHVRSTNNLENPSFEIIEGTAPKNNNELMINKKVAIDSNYKIGDTITLNLGTRITTDDFELDDSNPYHEELETLINTKSHTYKIVGIFKKSEYNHDYTGITTKDKTDKIDAYIALKEPKNHEKTISEIISQKKSLFPEDNENSAYKYEINNELLRWEIFAFSDSTVSMLYSLVIVVIIIIVGTSIFCIRNSFAISTTEKTKMYGMLSSIGATKKQIKKCVILEGFILGIIAIPLGILFGSLAVYILVKIVNALIGDYLFRGTTGVIFNISIFPILGSILLGFITIYLSAISSARKASRVSPIENLRNSKDITLNKKELKTPAYITKIFKTGGSLAYKNLRRSKKKYRTTVVSLTISILVFISMSSFINDSFDLTNKYYTSYDYNLSITGVRNLTNTEISKIKNLNGVDKLFTLYKIQDNSNGYIKITDKTKINLNESRDFFMKDCNYNENDERICTEDPYIPLEINALDDDC